MIVLDPGHIFAFDQYDEDGPPIRQLLHFVKRVGDKYPGNMDAHPGTITQEVLRALISRQLHVNGQEPDDVNDQVIHHLRWCLCMLEMRAARRRNQPFQVELVGIENIPTCPVCGHIFCKEIHAD